MLIAVVGGLVLAGLFLYGLATARRRKLRSASAVQVQYSALFFDRQLSIFKS